MVGVMGIALMLAIEYWYLVVGVVGIVPINYFPLWTALGIWAASWIALFRQMKSAGKLETSADHFELLKLSGGFTAIVVGIALLIPVLLEGGGDGHIVCSRTTPHGC